MKYLKNTQMSNAGINKDLTPQEGDGGVKEKQVYAVRGRGQRL